MGKALTRIFVCQAMITTTIAFIVAGCGNNGGSSIPQTAAAATSGSGNLNTNTSQTTTSASGIITTIVSARFASTAETARLRNSSSDQSASTSNSTDSSSSSSSPSSNSLSTPIDAPDYTGHLSQANVYVGGSTVNANVFMNSIYKSYYRASSKGVSVTSYGAQGDGVTDNTKAFANALAASDVVFVPSGNFLVAGRLYIGNNKSIVGTSNTSYIKPTMPYGFVVQGRNIVIQNIHFIGSLSSTKQYKQDSSLSTSMFNGAILVDTAGNAVPASQASVTITDAKNLSISVHGKIGTSSGPFYLKGTVQGLNPSNRYYLHSNANFISGAGALLPIFKLNGDTLYVPGNSSGTPYFTNASSLTIQLSAGRRSTDPTTLTVNFRIGNLSYYHAANEMATADTLNDESKSYIFVESGQDIAFLNNDFSLFDTAVLKISGTQNMYFLQNTVRQSFGGVTTQNGQNNFFINNSIDNQLQDDLGNTLNHSIIRSHGFSVSYDSSGTLRESNDQFVSNKISGASWGFESAVTLSSPNVSFNTISGGQVGISLANMYGLIANNTISLDGFSRMGIEVPSDGANVSHDVTVSGNSINMNESSMYNVGLSVTSADDVSTGLYNFNVTNNAINAPIGFQFINVRAGSQKTIVLTNNEVTDLGLAGFIRQTSGIDFLPQGGADSGGSTFNCAGAIKLWGMNNSVPSSNCN